uniref:Uncharacterized protein n=1 Tax=Anguilla anguilla TaxID=7936 RepID=A0A0E9TKW1_ANGAN
MFFRGFLAERLQEVHLQGIHFSSLEDASIRVILNMVFSVLTHPLHDIHCQGPAAEPH